MYTFGEIYGQRHRVYIDMKRTPRLICKFIQNYKYLFYEMCFIHGILYKNPNLEVKHVCYSF